MIPVLGQKYDIHIEVTSKPKAVYLTDEYFERDLPVATAGMVGDEIVVEGSDVGQFEVESAICRDLDLPPPTPEEKVFFKNLIKS